MKILITGSNGLIGSEAVIYYERKENEVHGIDNNMRKIFFGEMGDTLWNLSRMKKILKHFSHHDIDIRNFEGLETLFKKITFDVIIHCAAQPSHDKAREIPLIDFEVNATGTLNLLEVTRRFSPEAIFIYMSTNKVYGDVPNRIPLKELDTRWEYAEPENYNGINENCPVDQCLHSLFGASKLAGDILAQEYGRYFGMKVGIFRGGCLTGPQHTGVELHGFLSYLVKAALNNIPYTIYGYKGKQVRDNIHCKDVVKAFDAFIDHPYYGEVYNLGGGRGNSVSVVEAIRVIEEIAKVKIKWCYTDKNRIGDHICYISDISKLKADFPGWNVTINLNEMLEEMVDFERRNKK